MKKLLFLYLGTLLFFIACKKETTEVTLNPNAAITLKVNELYSKYGKSNDAVYNQPIPNDLFSSGLKKALENAINASKEDIEKVKKSDHPDEKPLIFEGAIFSSLYEGYTHYEIQSVKVNGKTAVVPVKFEYDMSSPKLIWTDTIHLIESDKKWKIDNITFDTIGSAKDLKTVLKEFAQSTRE
ncbi:nuclear transport factor 2 family protein [Chryseobacterium sp. Tr-659]|uniref:nuclear transport factor 2 family protein n=1 Tax=Chryseobacterium sp. Tr-659 TaxID=2608340 RepID=UPI00141F87C9|nr:nuclear transport factor 2 family protein [Chryseobacterium sp. Tr-659]NIF05028.1 nuclear transport factor 2 family protein [Chryseobacterium sp. Tr-659]